MSYHPNHATDETVTFTPPESKVKTDTYKRDKTKVIAWLCAVLGTGVIGWGVWATTTIYDTQAASKLEADRIIVNDQASRERDKAISDASAERTAQIQVQLTQIQTQLSQNQVQNQTQLLEIQRYLRKGRP